MFQINWTVATSWFHDKIQDSSVSSIQCSAVQFYYATCSKSKETHKNPCDEWDYHDRRLQGQALRLVRQNMVEAGGWYPKWFSLCPSLLMLEVQLMLHNARVYKDVELNNNVQIIVQSSQCRQIIGKMCQQNQKILRAEPVRKMLLVQDECFVVKPS